MRRCAPASRAGAARHEFRRCSYRRAVLARAAPAANPVVVYFSESDAFVEAKSGEDLMDVRGRADWRRHPPQLRAAARRSCGPRRPPPAAT